MITNISMVAGKDGTFVCVPNPCGVPEMPLVYQYIDGVFVKCAFMTAEQFMAGRKAAQERVREAMGYDET